jgi:hypothetical protein
MCCFQDRHAEGELSEECASHVLYNSRLPVQLEPLFASLSLTMPRFNA